MVKKPKSTLEVGLGLGASALTFAASHKDLGRLPSGQHTAIDPVQETFWDSAGLKLLEDEALTDYVTCRLKPSALALPDLVKEARKFEMIYIDGSHNFEDVFVDMYFIRRILAEKGIVLFDDCTDRQVAKVIRFIRRNMSHIWEPFSLARYRLDKGQSITYRLAAFFGQIQLVAFRRKEHAGALRPRFKSF